MHSIFLLTYSCWGRKLAFVQPLDCPGSSAHLRIVLTSLPQAGGCVYHIICFHPSCTDKHMQCTAPEPVLLLPVAAVW